MQTNCFFFSFAVIQIIIHYILLQPCRALNCDFPLDSDSMQISLWIITCSKDEGLRQDDRRLRRAMQFNCSKVSLNLDYSYISVNFQCRRNVPSTLFEISFEKKSKNVILGFQNTEKQTSIQQLFPVEFGIIQAEFCPNGEWPHCCFLFSMNNKWGMVASIGV